MSLYLSERGQGECRYPDSRAVQSGYLTSHLLLSKTKHENMNVKRKIIPVWMMASVSGGASRSAALIVSLGDNGNISSVSFIFQKRTSGRLCVTAHGATSEER